MQIKCQRTALLDAIQTAAAAVPSRTTKPVLYNVKLVAKGDAVTVFGTDLEIGVRSVCEADCRKGGSVLLPAARSMQMLRESSEPDVSISTNAGSVSIAVGRAQYKVGLENPDDYPDVGEFAGDYHTIASDAMSTAIRRTVFATDEDATRYALGGVHFAAKDGVANFVSTDTKRLSVVTCEAKQHGSPKSGVIIPEKAMAIVGRMCGSADEVRLAVRDNDVMFSVGRGMVYSRLVEGRFPRWADVVPKVYIGSFRMVSGDLSSVMRQAQIATSLESLAVHLDISYDQIKATAESAESGSAKIEVAIQYEGQPTKLCLDPRLVIEALRAAGDCEIDVKISEGPIVFECDGFQHVVMPIEK